jgi:protein-tyrosine phosphatase
MAQHEFGVLFVCLGNICRSPMAEAVFRHLAERHGLAERLHIDSAGTGSWHVGEPPHEGTRRLLERHGISCEGIRARQLRREDGDAFDLIVAMDAQNERTIRSMIGADRKAEVIRFMSLLPEKGRRDVPDPYYTGNFEEVYELVREGAERLLERVAERLGERIGR